MNSIDFKMSNEIYKELTRIPTLFEIEIGGKEKIKVVKYDDYMKLKQEIERLNNIINGLEKKLKDMATLKTDKYGNTRKITHIDINWLLLKIKELKGDGSNDNQRKTT